jgi:hypothetical protein
MDPTKAIQECKGLSPNFDPQSRVCSMPSLHITSEPDQTKSETSEWLLVPTMQFSMTKDEYSILFCTLGFKIAKSAKFLAH